MTTITIPDAIHCCPTCGDGLAVGLDTHGQPRSCEACERREPASRGSMRRLGFGFIVGLVIGALGLPLAFLLLSLR